MIISQATANLSLAQARALAQRLANQTDDCHIICDRRAQGQGHVVVGHRQATSQDFADSVDFAHPRYGGHDGV